MKTIVNPCRTHKKGKVFMNTKPRRTILWKILLTVFALLYFAVLELGKHTLLGWGLAVPLLLLFAYLRSRFLPQKGFLIRLLAGFCFLILMVCILVVSWPPVRPVPATNARQPVKTEVLHLPAGDVRGVFTADGQVEVYAGIPYAKPPVGELRWKDPEPADPWEGILEADHFAPMSMQTQNLPIYSSLAQIIGYHDYEISLYDNYREPVSEDSLYLNIWKPAGKVSGLPVLVYVHGGSLQTGQPWYADYSGEGLARDGVIVVNMGYRLGIFGFFADEELALESPHHTTGNYGLLDQILALTWVQENIRAFGGDPENVTLAGESAGSACVSALCTSPLAKGLFTRVIGESSTVTAPAPAHSFRLLDDALAAGEQTLEQFHVTSAAELRELPAEMLAGELSRHHHITVDGYVLSETPYESYAKGIHNESAQLQGYNKEESGPFLLFDQASLDTYESKIRSSFPEAYEDEVLALFPATTDEEARQNWADIYTAVLFSYGHFCWERQALKNNIPVYPYYFTKENQRLSCWHSGEEVYFYGNIPENSSLYTEEDRQLNGLMQKYFLNFLTTGNPNGADLPRWNASREAGMVLELGNNVQMQQAPYLELYKILDKMYGFEEPSPFTNLVE